MLTVSGGHGMRGSDNRSGSLFSYVDLEARVSSDHPLRVIRAFADEVLVGMSAKFERGYSRIGRPSIAPERLMRALLLQAFYSIRITPGGVPSARRAN
jgi:transposase